MIYANFLNLIRQFVDWLSGISVIKKMWLLITLMAFGLIILLKHYDNREIERNLYFSKKIDSITVFYTRQLENCNTEKAVGYNNIMNVLQKSLESQQNQTLEIERLRLETERLKLKK